MYFFPKLSWCLAYICLAKSHSHQRASCHQWAIPHRTLLACFAQGTAPSCAFWPNTSPDQKGHFSWARICWVPTHAWTRPRRQYISTAHGTFHFCQDLWRLHLLKASSLKPLCPRAQKANKGLKIPSKRLNLLLFAGMTEKSCLIICPAQPIKI